MSSTRKTVMGLASVALASVVVGLGLGACSSSSSSSLSTGSLFGSSQPKVQSPAELVADRAVHAGTTAARAQRCGYVFDPASLRQNYLTFEGAQGNGPDLLAKAEKSYDYTAASVAKSIGGNDGYCDDAMTGIIKRDLTKALAGDFGAAAKRPDVGIFSESVEPMDREKIFHPMR